MKIQIIQYPPNPKGPVFTKKEPEVKNNNERKMKNDSKRV